MPADPTPPRDDDERETLAPGFYLAVRGNHPPTICEYDTAHGAPHWRNAHNDRIGYDPRDDGWKLISVADVAAGFRRAPEPVRENVADQFAQMGKALGVRSVSDSEMDAAGFAQPEPQQGGEAATMLVSLAREVADLAKWRQDAEAKLKGKDDYIDQLLRGIVDACGEPWSECWEMSWQDLMAMIREKLVAPAPSAPAGVTEAMPQFTNEQIVEEYERLADLWPDDFDMSHALTQMALYSLTVSALRAAALAAAGKA